MTGAVKITKAAKSLKNLKMSQEKDYPQFFADTSNISEIEAMMKLGIFSGITTNPLIVAKEAGSNDPSSYYKKIAEKFPELPISIQLLDESEEKLFEHAKGFAAIGANIVVKIPMFEDGRGLRLLPKLITEGISTNVTGLMTAEQILTVLLAGRGQGPTYVSLFFNRIKDGDGDPGTEINRSRDLIKQLDLETKIITGSIRKPSDVLDAVLAGTHIVTIAPPVFREMVKHPKSIEFIEQSQKAWEEYLTSQK